MYFCSYSSIAIMNGTAIQFLVKYYTHSDPPNPKCGAHIHQGIGRVCGWAEQCLCGHYMCAQKTLTASPTVYTFVLHHVFAAYTLC